MIGSAKEAADDGESLFALMSVLVAWVIVGAGAGTLATFVYARYSMVFPSAALDQRMSQAESWEFTRGNGWRLVFIIDILVALPIAVIELPIESLQSRLFVGGGIFESLIATFVSTLMNQTIAFISIAVGVSVLSITYRRLMPEMPPTPSTDERSKSPDA